MVGNVEWLSCWKHQLNSILLLVLLQQMAGFVKQLIFNLAVILLCLLLAHQVYVAFHNSLLCFVDSTNAALFKNSVANLEML